MKVPGGGEVNQVDILRDVNNLAHTHFSADIYSLPIKTEEKPHGIYTEQQLYMVLAILFIVIFEDLDVAKSFSLRQAGKTLTQQLGELVLFNVESIARTGFLADIVAKLHTQSKLSDYGTHMIQRLLSNGLSLKNVVWTHLLPTAGAGVANQAQLFAQTLDFYLEPQNKQHLQHLHQLSHENTPEADDLILR